MLDNFVSAERKDSSFMLMPWFFGFGHLWRSLSQGLSETP